MRSGDCCVSCGIPFAQSSIPSDGDTNDRCSLRSSSRDRNVEAVCSWGVTLRYPFAAMVKGGANNASPRSYTCV